MKDSHSDEEVSDVDVEKTNVGSHLELVESDEEIPDPDAGKSDEERARIVSEARNVPCTFPVAHGPTYRIGGCCGGST